MEGKKCNLNCNFYPFKYNCKSDIEHFNLNHHNYMSHFKFYVFNHNYTNTTELLLAERILINFISNCNNSVLNDYIPYLSNYDHQLLFNQLEENINL